ncbi:leucine-rich repeat and death domain-containing protein 1-like [Mercenaria mercenaria]|uniref:leucine-rich repeat and death domain-containing protein 1-like n=1 Tax=Mercenaria mercenaria TaxID=6596 RepID=UPI00234ED16E|nr:leucine-rich repeat and death domain-containing protein 1-like [Mercenaria mercenaria]
MMRSSRVSYFEKEVLKELRLRVETNDPLFYGQKKLKMRGKDLKAIPHVLFTMMDLEVLDLSPERESCLDFRLPLVPPSIGRLINLKVLMLDTNELYNLPKEICLLQSLERLSLSNNVLTSLPHGIGRLPLLRSLHMSNNKFDAFPLEVCELKALEFLDLSDNLLVSIPKEISNLKTLGTLLLNYNKLIHLPDELCELVDLECLWLGNNRLRELPHNFGNLVRLDWGYRYTSSVLECNPLVHPPLEICRLGPRKINEYFKDLDSVREISTAEFEGDEEELQAIETESESEKEGNDAKTPVADET